MLWLMRVLLLLQLMVVLLLLLVQPAVACAPR